MAMIMHGYVQRTLHWEDDELGRRYQHQDVHVGAFKVLEGARIKWHDDRFGESRERTVRVVAPCGVEPDLAIEALRDMFRYQCHCEHDCCAHWQASATAKRIKGRDYSVNIWEYMNV
jgi:hypothetical protein